MYKTFILPPNDLSQLIKNHYTNKVITIQKGNFKILEIFGYYYFHHQMALFSFFKLKIYILK